MQDQDTSEGGFILSLLSWLVGGCLLIVCSHDLLCENMKREGEREKKGGEGGTERRRVRASACPLEIERERESSGVYSY